MSKIKVTGCKDCPFRESNDMDINYSCSVVKRIDNTVYNVINPDEDTWQPITPLWCPLKKEPITIEIDELV